MPGEFTCAICNRTLQSSSTAEESTRYKRKWFPDVPLDDCDSICDDCLPKFHEWFLEHYG